jgi:hypothetical protein
MKPAGLTHDTLAVRSGRSSGRNTVRRASDGRHARRLFFESLEDRTLLSSGSIVEVAAAVNRPLASEASPLTTPLGRGTASPVGLNPAQIQNAYGFNTIAFQGGVQGDGTGQTIAIIDAYRDSSFVPSNDPTFESSDLAQFDKQFDLPDPSLTIATPDGMPQQAPLPNAQGYSWAAETALDVEWAHALAPGAAILLVETPGGNASQIDQGLIDGVNYARQQQAVSVISMSWSLSTMVSDATFTTPSGHQGITFVTGSGDNGSPATYPATSPNVLSVGGTYFPAALDAVGDYSGESAWDASGGGVDTSEPQLTAQTHAIGAMGGRAVPDVAFDAGSSVAVYDSYDYGATPWTSLVGTSLGAPAWSALVAIADQGRVLLGTGTLDGATQTIPDLYSIYNQSNAYAAAFHDITTGANNLNKAGTGYSLVTGLGTPRAAGIASLLSGDVEAPVLVAPASGAVVTSTTPAFQWSPVAGSVGYNLTVTNTTTGANVLSYSTPTSSNGSAATSYPLMSPLPVGDSLSWTVRAVTAGGQVGESRSQSFVVLPIPVPVAPSGVIDSTQPTLSWLAVPGAADYTVTLADITAGTTIASGQAVSSTSYTPASPLENLHTYEWSVSALGAAENGGSPLASPASGSVYFTVNVDVAPVPIAPANGTAVSNRKPMFAWSGVPGAVSYKLRIANEDLGPNHPPFSISVSGTSFTPRTPLALLGSYNWSVQAVIEQNGRRTPGPSSNVSHFLVSKVGEPTLISPEPDAVVNTDQFQFQWSAVPGNLVNYDFSLFDITSNTAVYSEYSLEATSFTPSIPLDNGHEYVWSVFAGKGGVLATAEAQFTVDVTGGGSQILSAPKPLSPDGIVNTTSPELRWSAVSGADFYVVFLSNSPYPLRVSGTSLTLSPDLLAVPITNDSGYSWYVTAGSDSGNFSTPSSSAAFVVSVPASDKLAAPGHLSPSGTVTTNTPTLSWSRVSRANVYFEILVDETAGTVATIGGKRATSIKIGTRIGEAPLINGHTYAYYVYGTSIGIGPRAKHVYGQLASQVFTVSGPRIGVPIPTVPGNNAVVTTTTTKLQWSAVPGSVRYLLQLEDATDPLSAKYNPISVAGTSYTPNEPLVDGHTYRWQVSAVVSIDGFDTPGPNCPFTEFTVSIPGPAALIAQGDSGVVTTATPTLQWSPVTGASGYYLYLGDTTTGTQIYDALPVISTSYQVTAPLKNGDSYLWYVTAYDNYGNISIAPAALAFTVNVPPAAVLVPNPVPIGHPVGETPTLQWTTVPMATSYDLFITDSTTEQRVQPFPIAVSLGSGSMSGGYFTYTLAPEYALPAVSDHYTFYVQAVSNGLPGPPGPTTTFTVSTAPDLSNPPTPEGPEGLTDMTQPAFQWSMVTNAANYEIEIDDTTNGTISTVLEPSPVSGTSYMPSLALILGHTYQWQVEAVNSAGQPSVWSKATFQVLPASPATPNAPSGTTNSATPTLQWSTVDMSEVVSYQIQVADITGGQSTVVANANNITALSYQLSAPLVSGHTYQWEVAANYGTGQYSAWSSPLVFTVVLATSPTPNSPSGTITSATPTLKWSAVNLSGAVSYQIRVTDATGKSVIATASNITGLQYQLPTPLTPGQSYQWQVAANYGTGQQTAWSSPLTFHVTLPAPSPVSPNGTTSPTIPTFTWMAVTGATGYQIEVLQATGRTVNVIFKSGKLSELSTALTFALMPGQTYQWSVAAYDSSGAESAWSIPASFTIGLPLPSVVGMPVAGHVKSNVSTIAVMFNEPLAPQADSTAFYKVFEGTNKGGNYTYTNSVRIKSVKPGRSNGVNITLARPVKGPLKLVVLAGIPAANGARSTSSESFDPIS